MQADYKNRDQAQMLRQLAQPQQQAYAAAGTERVPNEQRVTLEHAPQVILLSELPSLQSGFPIALHLAQQLNDRQPGTLLVDLAPAASRLPDTITTTGENFATWVSKIQALWSNSPHGRTLHNWKETAIPSVDILAQPSGDFPSIEQMPRICEQLVRQIANQGRANSHQPGKYQNVLMLSESVGVPLDSACWQAADVVILLHDYDLNEAQLQSILSARIVMKSHGQRLILLRKRALTLRDWTTRRRLQRRDDVPAARMAQLPFAEFWDVLWPHMVTRRTAIRLSRSMRSTALELVLEFQRCAITTRPTRQAS